MTQMTGITRRLGWLVTRMTTIKRMTALSGITGVTEMTLTRFLPLTGYPVYQSAVVLHQLRKLKKEMKKLLIPKMRL